MAAPDCRLVVVVVDLLCWGAGVKMAEADLRKFFNLFSLLFERLLL